MKRCLLAFIALSAVSLAVLSPEAHAEGFVHADHQRIVDGNGKPLILRGMGLGGWMVQEGYMLGLPNLGAEHVIRSRISKIIGARRAEQFYQSWRDNAVTKADIDAMAGWGFNSVRLPMHWNLFIKDMPRNSGPSKIVWNEEGFRRVDALIAWLKANHMLLILDLHAAPGGQGNDPAISDRNPQKPSCGGSGDNQAKMIALLDRNRPALQGRADDCRFTICSMNRIGVFRIKPIRTAAAKPAISRCGTFMSAPSVRYAPIDTNHMLIIERQLLG